MARTPGPPTAGGDEVGDSVDRWEDARRRPAGPPRLLAMSAAVVAVTAAALLAGPLDGSTPLAVEDVEDRLPTAADASEPLPLGAGCWTLLHDVPLEGRRVTVLGWDGEQLLAAASWAEHGRPPVPATHVAALDPDAGTWAMLPPARLAGRYAYDGALVDGGALVLGTRSGEPAAMARLDLRTGEWDTAAAPRLSRTPVIGEVGGGGIVVRDRRGRRSTGAHRYHPAEDAWQVLPEAPVSASSAGVVDYHGDLALAGRVVEADERMAITVHDPVADRWSPPDLAPVDPSWEPAWAAHPDGGVVFIGPTDDGVVTARWQHHESWELLDWPAPALPAGSPTLETLDRHLVLLVDGSPAEASLFDVDRQSWQPVRPPPVEIGRERPELVWTGTSLLVIGGQHADGAPATAAARLDLPDDGDCDRAEGVEGVEGP